MGEEFVQVKPGSTSPGSLLLPSNRVAQGIYGHKRRHGWKAANSLFCDRQGQRCIRGKGNLNKQTKGLVIKEELQMGQSGDPMATLRAFEQILPELKRISQQELKPEEIKAELEKASKGELVEHHLKLIMQHFDVIRAFVALAEATEQIVKSSEEATE